MPPGKFGKPRKRKSSGKHDKHGGRVRQLRQVRHGGAAAAISTAEGAACRCGTAISAAERSSNCDKYSGEERQLR